MKQFNLLINKAELETLIWCLRDETVDYANRLAVETDEQEICFLEESVSRSNDMLAKLESINLRNNLGI